MKEANVTRVIDAPREQVWRAFTEPERFAQWFGTPPHTTPLSTVSMDVRPGSEWRATMVHESDGSELPSAAPTARSKSLSGSSSPTRT